MWYCEKCGQPNEGKFCNVCGTEHNGSTFEKNDFSTGGKDPKKKKSNKALIIGIIAAAAIVLVGLIVGIGVIRGSEDNNEEQSTGVFYYVSTGGNTSAIYEESNADSKVLLYLEDGSPVEFLNEENSVFCYIKDHNSGISGYMRSDELVKNIDEVQSEPEETEEEKIEKENLGYYYVTNTKSSLSLREAANSDANVIVKLFNGYKLALLEKTSDQYWFVYDYNSGERGYVLKEYLTDNPDKVKNGKETEYVQPQSKTVTADYYVTGTKNYLAIRSTPSSSSSSEIGKTYNGNKIGLIEKTNGTFWYVYDYSSGLYGYVKCGYLTSNYTEKPQTSLADDEYLVSGTKNYLALRSEPATSESNEIGKTYNGNKVQVLEKTNDEFWYVYDYSTGIKGYVKCAYLTK